MDDFKDAKLTYSKGSHKLVKWTCPDCNSEFIKPFKNALRSQRCKPCNNIARPKPDFSGKNNPFYGKQHSNEFIIRMTGEGNPRWLGGKEAYNKCLECGILLCGRNVEYCPKHWQIGPRNPMWTGEYSQEEREKLRNTPEYKIWAKAVKVRDNFTCQKCNTRGGILHSHHIKRFSQYPELRYEISNGITLCKECHIKEHSYKNDPPS